MGVCMVSHPKSDIVGGQSIWVFDAGDIETSPHSASLEAGCFRKRS